VIENSTYTTSSNNGVTYHAWRGVKADLFALRNTNYAFDPRYAFDDKQDNHSGLPFVAFPKEFDIDNFWSNHVRESQNYGILNGQRYGAREQAGFIIKLPRMFAGEPPGGDFAPASRTGKEYHSPF